MCLFAFSFETGPYYRDRVGLELCCVGQAGLKLVNNLASAFSQFRELQAFITTPLVLFSVFKL